MAWDSEQYLKFANERKQPCIDLLSRLNGTFNTILDLGCGPGNSTKNLKEKFSYAEITGFDSDENMLEKAKKDYPQFNFVKGFAPEDLNRLDCKFDLVFSNACIHWIKNQEKLISEVYELLNENGIFAVQIPLTNESQFYKVLYKLIQEKWTKLKSVNNFYNLNQEEYYNILIKKFKNLTIWQSNYYHIVERKLILEWYKGSGLRPYLAMFDNDEQKIFLNDLQRMIDQEYNVLCDNKIFLIMPRLFFIAEGKK